MALAASLPAEFALIIRLNSTLFRTAASAMSSKLRAARPTAFKSLSICINSVWKAFKCSGIFASTCCIFLAALAALAAAAPAAAAAVAVAPAAVAAATAAAAAALAEIPAAPAPAVDTIDEVGVCGRGGCCSCWPWT
ncbi:hypothetical protein BACERE00185_00118 [Bacillus mobilis]|uniref:Uncharacterized protein n=1 Tax=Bacillus mobilis TaxID=2026190 RepID=A0A1Y5YWK8_9BACI|nr:hypothetical protein BACERE00185_00118 [Bacillus mobilis]